MQRYFIELSYDGTNYHGWQQQPNGVSVQEVLDKALHTYFRFEVKTTGSGRTDTGVHARQQFVHLNLPKAIEAEELKTVVNSLNGLLPYDIAVRRIFPVEEEAHARFDASSRTYHYWIVQHKNPFYVNRAYFLKSKLDLELMNRMAAILMEYTDFSSFSRSNTQVKTNNCKIYKAEWIKVGERIEFHIRANRFLRNMVRAVVGTLIDCGLGKIDEKEFREIIEGRNRSNAGASVPACGLYLVRVDYPYIKYPPDGSR